MIQYLSLELIRDLFLSDVRISSRRKRNGVSSLSESHGPRMIWNFPGIQIPGNVELIGEPSRYLRMIPEQLLDYGNTGKQESVRTGAGTDGAGRKSDLQQLRRQVQDQIRLKREAAQKPEVVRVRHRKYGEGILVSEDEMMIEAEFEGYGRKQFLKGFWRDRNITQLRSRKEMFKTASLN